MKIDSIKMDGKKLKKVEINPKYIYLPDYRFFKDYNIFYDENADNKNLRKLKLSSYWDKSSDVYLFINGNKDYEDIYGHIFKIAKDTIGYNGGGIYDKRDKDIIQKELNNYIENYVLKGKIWTDGKNFFKIEKIEKLEE